jgi:acyl carrier protein
MLAKAVAKAVLRAADAAHARLALAGAARVEAGVRVLGWPSVVSEGELIVERDVVLVARPSPVEILLARGARVVVGAGSVLESGASLRARRRIVIGRNVRVGAGCIIDDDGPKDDGIEIGEDAWLEDGAIVVGGARVAARARVGARAAASATSLTPLLVKEASPIGGGDDAVRQIVGRVLPGALETRSDADLRHIPGWDSLAALRILVALEKEFRVTLPQDLFATGRSLESVKVLLGERGHTA